MLTVFSDGRPSEHIGTFPAGAIPAWRLLLNVGYIGYIPHDRRVGIIRRQYLVYHHPSKARNRGDAGKGVALSPDFISINFGQISIAGNIQSHLHLPKDVGITPTALRLC